MIGWQAWKGCRNLHPLPTLASSTCTPPGPRGGGGADRLTLRPRPRPANQHSPLLGLSPRGDDKTQVRQSRTFPETLGKASSSGQGWGSMRGQPCESLCPEPLEPAMPETSSLIFPGLQLGFSEEPETVPLSHRPTGPRG